MDRFVSFRFLKALSLCVVTAAVGCSDGGDTSTRQPLESDRISVVNGQQFDEVFIVVDSLVLEESKTVITVSPTVSLDPRGGFLVADSREGQVRVYSRQGELEQVFGAGTTRASSFDRPQRAKRLPNGDIVLRDAEDGREPLVRIRFSREVQDMLGEDLLSVAEAMIEAATDHIAGDDSPEEPPVVTSPVLH